MDDYQARMRRQYHERKQLGVCVQTGCGHKAIPGRGSRCAGCADYLAFIKRAARELRTT
jgi:hypothetical protein